LQRVVNQRRRVLKVVMRNGAAEHPAQRVGGHDLPVFEPFDGASAMALPFVP
jgi:hypothetical protein